MNEHTTLLELQEVDAQIDALNYREKNLPERDRYKALAAESMKMEGLHGAIANKLHDESAVQKRHEDELNSFNTKIDKEQKRLYSGTITNPKELTSVQQEIEHLKGHADEKELELLEQIEVVDKLKSDEKIVADRLRAKKAEVDAAKADMERVLGEIAAQRAKFQQQREPLDAALSDETKQLYARVRAKYPLAVTVLEEGLCRGCRVEIPSTDAERIMASQEFERCPNCGRIIAKK